VVADAEIGADPEQNLDTRIPNANKYCFAFPLTRVRTYVDTPVVLNHHLRSRLEALGHKEDASWAWFVHDFHDVSKSDFEVLIHTVLETPKQ